MKQSPSQLFRILTTDDEKEKEQLTRKSVDEVRLELEHDRCARVRTLMRRRWLASALQLSVRAQPGRHLQSMRLARR